MSTITFSVSSDMTLVKSIVTTPQIYRASSDEGSPAPELFEPPKDYQYAVVRDGAELLGCYALEPRNSVSFDIHTCLLPIAWGRATEISTAFLEWLWAHSNCLRLTTRVPTFNRLALRLAKCCGMLEFGRDVQSFKKNGRLYDEILLGISRPRVT